MKPDAVSRAERLLGRDATEWARVASRGWSLNEHWTVAFRDGTRAFLKIASIDPSPQWVRDEVHVYELVRGPFMPQFLGFEDGEEPLLALEDCSPGAEFPPPWSRAQVDAVLATLQEVGEAEPRGELPRLADSELAGWREIAADPGPFLSLGVVSPEWLDAALPALLAADKAAPVDGTSVVHGDVRSDNLCLREGRCVLFDWNHACLGNSAFDIAAWLPSLAFEGGPEPLEVADDEVNAIAVVIAGFFAAHAGLPPPEGAPRVRAFQLAQLGVALPWASAVLGL